MRGAIGHGERQDAERVAINPTRSGRLLCAAIADVPDDARARAATDLIDEMGSMDAFDLAARHEVAAHVGHALGSALQGPDADVWQEAHGAVAERTGAFLAELDRVAAGLADEGISVIALKNAGIARALYPCIGCCPMGDIDVLVDRANFAETHRYLLSQGYAFEARGAQAAQTFAAAELAGEAEYHKSLPGGFDFWLEVLWRPVGGRWIRPDQEPTTREIIDRAVPVEGTAVRILSPEDNLLQVALHTAKHSFVRAPGLRLHTDVDRIVRRQTVDWAVVVGRARRLEVATPAYFSLIIPARLFGTPIPEDALQALAPGPQKLRTLTTWIERAGILEPGQRKFTRPKYVAFHALLYDDLGGLRRALLPTASWMRQRYRFERPWLLPYYHGKRLWDLLFRRAAT